MKNHTHRGTTTRSRGVVGRSSTPESTSNGSAAAGTYYYHGLLAQRHLAEGGLVLYDLTWTYFEGRHCPWGRLGHSRDDKSGKLQIVFGLLTNAEGCPVAVEVVEGNTADPKTVPDQVKKLRARFGLKQVILVGDRGMITSARIREDCPACSGMCWITALRATSGR